MANTGQERGLFPRIGREMRKKDYGLIAEILIAAYQLILGRRLESKAAIYFLPLWPEAKWVCTLIRGGLRLRTDLHDSYVSFGCLMDDYEPLETSAFRRGRDRFEAAQ
jgi:hypothetical protein